jgi:hypothetical protein
MEKRTLSLRPIESMEARQALEMAGYADAGKTIVLRIVKLDVMGNIEHTLYVGAAQSTGKFAHTLRLPSGWEPGDYTVIASDGNLSASETFTLEP